MGFEIVSEWLDKIPEWIAKFRELVIKIINLLNLPEQSTFVLIAMLASVVGAFYFLKQWVTKGLFFKASTLLNWILLAIIFYLVLTYV